MVTPSNCPDCLASALLIALPSFLTAFFTFRKFRSFLIFCFLLLSCSCQRITGLRGRRLQKLVSKVRAPPPREPLLWKFWAPPSQETLLWTIGAAPPKKPLLLKIRAPPSKELLLPKVMACTPQDSLVAFFLVK